MQCLYIYCCRNISEGFSFYLIAEYLLFHRSRRHFIPRCVNSHPRPGAFIYSGKYSQVRSVPLFSRVPCPISETRPLCKYSFSRLRRCGKRCGKTSRAFAPIGYSQVRTIDTSHVALATSMGNPNRKDRNRQISPTKSFRIDASVSLSHYAAILSTK